MEKVILQSSDVGISLDQLVDIKRDEWKSAIVKTIKLIDSDISNAFPDEKLPPFLFKQTLIPSISYIDRNKQ
jgi:hypothetical protein